MYSNMKTFTLNQPAHCSGVETGNHFKNGANPKSHTSRENLKSRVLFILVLFTLVLSVFALVSCKDDDSANEDASFLAAPANVTASQSSSSPCVLLSWSEVPGATYYEVYRSSTSAPNSSYEEISYEEEAFSEDWSPLTGDNYYKIKAVKESGHSEVRSDFSAYAYCKYSYNTGNGGTTAPSAPTGVTASAQSSSSISVSWSSVSGATGYKVYYEIGTSSTKNLAGTVSGTSYTHTGLTASTTYYYYIVAVNSAGESSYSSSASATTSSSGSGDGGGGTAPSAPTGVTASATSSSSISVSWNSVSGATSYKVYYEIGSSSTKNLAGTVSGTSYTHTGLTASTRYYYYIVAVNSAGESGYSSNTYATTQSGSSGGGGTAPSAPTGVTASATSSSSISVSWNSVSSATSYKVYYEIGSSSTKNLAGTVSGTSYTHTGLTASTTYYYYIKAVNSAGESGYSSYASATTQSGSSGGGTTQKLATPTNLQAYSSGSFVQISFTEVSLAYTYELYRSTSANGTYSKITASGGSSGSSYVLTDSNPRSGTSYYKVKAIPLSSLTYLTASDLSSYVSVTR
jgi:fibronectin type 3 domain-containing protein